MNKISGVYKITNVITGDFYIGSSKDVKRRWTEHKCPSNWKQQPNNLLYIDFRKYGLDKFQFQILVSIIPEYLKKVEQDYIELMKPTYNNYNAKGLNIQRRKEYKKAYNQSEERREANRNAMKKYRQSEKGHEAQKKYEQSDKYKEYHKRYSKSEKGLEGSRRRTKKYFSKVCIYNGETLTLSALSKRFFRTGISHPVLEAKKYLITNY